MSEGEEGGERARATRTERPREEEADADAAPHAFTLLDPPRAVPAEQVYGGLVFMDFNSRYFESEGFGRYERLDVSRLPRLHLMHLRESGGQSGRIHSDVRRRFLEGDTEVAEAMREFAGIAERGRSILVGSAEGGEDGAVAEALAGEMRSNFALRRKLFGDAVLGAENLEMVELAESDGGRKVHWEWRSDRGALPRRRQAGEVNRRGVRQEGFRLPRGGRRGPGLGMVSTLLKKASGYSVWYNGISCR